MRNSSEQTKHSTKKNCVMSLERWMLLAVAAVLGAIFRLIGNAH
jgi:hypothetical protein